MDAKDEEMRKLMDAKVKAMREELMNEIMLKYQPRTSHHHEDDDAERTSCPPPKSGYDSCTVSKDLSQIPEVNHILFF
jgi:hypothetical protein